MSTFRVTVQYHHKIPEFSGVEYLKDPHTQILVSVQLIVSSLNDIGEVASASFSILY